MINEKDNKPQHSHSATIDNDIKAKKALERMLDKINKDIQINMRVTEDQYKLIETQMKKFNFSSISEYLRFSALNINIEFKTVIKE